MAFDTPGSPVSSSFVLFLGIFSFSFLELRKLDRHLSILFQSFEQFAVSFQFGPESWSLRSPNITSDVVQQVVKITKCIESTATGSYVSKQCHL